MDLLIKNMDIPKNGNLTLVIHPNGEVYLGDVLEDIKIGKAIELPPHGRLGDLDEAEKAIKARYDSIDRKENGDWLSHDDAMFCNGLVRALQSVKYMSTFVEAST